MTTIRWIGAMVATVFASVAVAASAQDMPQVRDSRTGKVWTPQAVEIESSAPSSRSDRAFDPRAQVVPTEGLTVQHPHATLMGTVPITAGPTVPIVTLDVPTLQVLPARYWLSILYLTNNSASTVTAVIGCHFNNGNRRVADVRVVVPPAGPGERLGLPVHGPRYDVFVDHVTCEVISPT